MLCNGEKFNSNFANQDENGGIRELSDIERAMQVDQERRDEEISNQVLKQFEQLQEKIKKQKRKKQKLQKKLSAEKDINQKLRGEVKKLEEKNKQLGWLILQEQLANGKSLPKDTFIKKSGSSILHLIDSDISDKFLEE